MNFRPTYGNQKSARPLKFAGGSIQFDQVSFRYNSQQPLIHDFSLKIQAGQTVLVVGPSGAGKSTLLKLICRLRDATGGTLRVNDQDVRDVDVSRFVASIVSSVYRLARISSLLTSGSLRDRIGVVPQAPVLFDDSIMNNVRYGRITASDEEVYEACKAACIHHRINEFVKGYNTRVGQRGMKLSTGEIHLLAIARVLLRKPNVLLLDEPTSALNNHTTEQLRNSLVTGFQGITTVLFSHNPRALPHASLVVVLEGGQIVEQGSHDDLIRTGGTFAKMWNNTESLHGTVGVPSTIRESPKLIEGPNEPTKGLNVQDVVVSTGVVIASSPTQHITSTKKEVRLYMTLLH
jgi:ABC-type multidrug transport system fused ATPase/permease subunit